VPREQVQLMRSLIRSVPREQVQLMRSLIR
jgi:hypothetical protein